MVSIIIPTYNSGDFISATLDSIKNQAYSDVEIIIINDGSTDNTDDIVTKWMTLYPTIKVVYKVQKNGGVSFARNSGLQLATGDYVMFCDSDDIMHPSMIKTFVETLDKYQVDTIACTFTHNQQENELLSISSPDRTDLKELFLFNNSMFTFCGFIYKRSILQKYGIMFSEDLKFGEDEEFTWKYLCHINEAMFIRTPFYYYRTNPASATQREKKYDRTQVIASVQRVCAYYQQFNNPFEIRLKNYGVPRAKIAILREFAIAENKTLYSKLRNDANYFCKMSNVLVFPSLKVKMAALLYVISPSLFYFLFSSTVLGKK